VTNTPAAPVFPPGRYGHRREPRRARRLLPVALLVLLLLGALAVAVRLYDRYGDPAYRSQVTVDRLSDSGADITLTVTKRDTAPAVCRVQALDRTEAEIGYAEVPVGSGGTVSVRYPLPTRGRAYDVEVLGCQRA
jgi:hypothetical protein